MRDADEGVRGEAVKAIFHMTLDNPSRTEKAVLDEVALRMRDKKVPLFFFSASPTVSACHLKHTYGLFRIGIYSFVGYDKAGGII